MWKEIPELESINMTTHLSNNGDVKRISKATGKENWYEGDTINIRDIDGRQHHNTRAALLSRYFSYNQLTRAAQRMVDEASENTEANYQEFRNKHSKLRNRRFGK